MKSGVALAQTGSAFYCAALHRGYVLDRAVTKRRNRSQALGAICSVIACATPMDTLSRLFLNRLTRPKGRRDIDARTLNCCDKLSRSGLTDSPKRLRFKARCTAG